VWGEKAWRQMSHTPRKSRQDCCQTSALHPRNSATSSHPGKACDQLAMPRWLPLIVTRSRRGPPSHHVSNPLLLAVCEHQAGITAIRPGVRAAASDWASGGSEGAGAAATVDRPWWLWVTRLRSEGGESPNAKAPSSRRYEPFFSRASRHQAGDGPKARAKITVLSGEPCLHHIFTIRRLSSKRVALVDAHPKR